MANTMKRSEVIKWLQSHGGQHPENGYSVTYIEIPNPNYNASTKYTQPEKIRVKEVTWKAKDGQTLTVQDREEVQNEATQETRTPYSPDYDPEYEQPEINRDVKEPPPDKTPNVTAFNEEVAKEKKRQMEANAAKPGGRYETDDERDDRIAKDQKREDDLQARRDANAINNRQVSVAEAAERRQAEEAAQRAKKPEFLSRADPDSKSIAMYDPVTGQIRTVDNPNYDEAKANAARLKDELGIAVQLQKISADEAAAKFDRWFKQNVEIPFMQSKEARDRAAEQRAALDAEERRRQFASDFGLRKATLGQQAGQDAAQNEIALLPYRAGPTEAAEMSSAINSLAHGGSMDSNASAGINFTADAFKFDRPDFEGIAKRATKAAIGHLTDYRPSDEQYSTADYSGISMPTSETMAGAPQPAAPAIDLQGMFNTMTGGKYAPQ